ncbi:Lysophospholipid acyltransferase family protein [Rhodovastum atsumiense]|uniref:Lysophospholipid acyltransferase family protein n=1 Tax=Rhodovastum atsumiense TaxID=504468 RepID=A0A5M6IY75_9PROT|nr:lysophospholipid acyltransferase family protein [Rhodovastum atsumiense]KAA5613306.1 lysophospholipid acyltransferase family protein [Rhodovastum atsumiense]CAH2600520.1 Lysophospholipid acyltransferase family protein [Rhodovastum atsumiense]
MLKRLLRRPSVQALLASLLGRYLAFALGTTRWTLHGEAHLAAVLAGGPAVDAFWHERLPLMPALWLRAQAQAPALRGHVLVSRHHDGRFIGSIMRRFSVGAVHGSTARNGQDRGGAAGLRALLGVLAAGEHVVITPDGPRGPRRMAAPGVAQLAALSGAPVLPCAAQISRRITLGTWDHMVLPLPFGRGVLVCAAPITVARDGWEAALPAIAAAMTEAAGEADRLCP